MQSQTPKKYKVEAKECIFINKSLLCQGNCWPKSLTCLSKQIKFRDHLLYSLTLLLSNIYLYVTPYKLSLHVNTPTI